MSMDSVSYSLVRDLFDYDPLTGILLWKNPRSNSVKPGTVAGNATKEGRIQVGIGGRMYRAHRIIWLWMTGEWPTENVDHEDLNGLNNSWDNLRLGNKSQNAANTARKSTNKSGFKGVTRSGQKWAATITKNYRATYIGSFPTAEEAAAAYDDAALRLHGPFAKTNKALGLL